MILTINNRGLIITIVGLILIGISLVIATSVLPSEITDVDNFSNSSLFEEMFDEIYDEIHILPGDFVYVSYNPLNANDTLLWGIQIVDFESEDQLYVTISNIFGDDYGGFIQDGPLLFEILEINQRDTLDFKIQNQGTQDITVVVMFSEDTKNSEIFSYSDSPINTVIVPLAVSGFLLILGIIILIIGIILLFVDWKNNQNNKRSY